MGRTIKRIRKLRNRGIRDGDEVTIYFLLVGAISLMTMVAMMGQLGIIPVKFQSVGECKTARPYFGSVNCVLDSTSGQVTLIPGQYFGGGYDDLHQLTGSAIDFSAAHVTCPSNWWLFTNQMNIIDLETGSKHFLCSRSTSETWQAPRLLYDCEEALQSFNFIENHLYKIVVACNDLGGGVYIPTGSEIGGLKFKVNAYGEHFTVSLDSGQDIPVMGSEGCKYNSVMDAYRSQQATSTAEAKKVVTAAQNKDLWSAWGLPNLPFFSTPITSMPADSKPDDGYWLFYTWVESPALNFGAYNSQRVYCDPRPEGQGHRIVRVDDVSTFGGCYTIPVSLLAWVECCGSDECQLKYGAGYYCDKTTYTCRQQAQCVSDYDCGSQSLCVKEENSYYLYGESRCVSGQCTTPSKTRVYCCSDSDCNPNEYCVPSEGCTTRIADCPEGMCCTTGWTYEFQRCDSSLLCCDTQDPDMGECKLKCSEDEPAFCRWWDLPCHIGNFLRDFYVSLGLPEWHWPTVGEGLIGALIGALILGGVGFLLGGPPGALIGILVGGVGGYALVTLLMILRQFTALLAFIVAMSFSWDFLERRIEDKNIRLAITIALALIVTYAVWLSYWYGAVCLGIFYILKLLWGLTPNESIIDTIKMLK